MVNATRSSCGGREQGPRQPLWFATKASHDADTIGASRAIRIHQAARSGRVILSLLVGVAVVSGALMANVQPVAAQGFRILIPSISTQGVGPGGASEETTECGLNAQEQAIADLMASDAGQRRDEPVCNAILSQVARARARDMASRNYFSHTNPDGDGPNLLAREAGYPLPAWYSNEQDANNIESIGGGYENAPAVWQGWLGSQSHRTHVLGTQAFYAEQSAFGVGYYYSPNSELKHYWVFLSAPLPE